MAETSYQLQRINFININRCNLRCIYCPQGSHPDEYHADLTPEFFEEILEFIAANEIVEAAFGYYGELTMVADWWKPVQRLLDRGVLVSTTTNGSTILTDEEVATFARFKYIEWSIDTHDVEILKKVRKKVDARTIIHNYHLVRSYCLLNALPTPVMVWTGVMTPDAASVLPRFVAYASSCGVGSMHFNEVGIYDGAPVKGLNVIEQDDVVFEQAAASIKDAIELAARLGVHLTIAEWPRVQARMRALAHGETYQPHLVRTSTPVAPVTVHTQGSELPPGHTRDCKSPWREFYLDPKGDVFACCVRGDVMGTAKTKAGLEAVFAGKKYEALRRSLETGVDLDNACANCIIRAAVPVAQVEQETILERSPEAANV